MTPYVTDDYSVVIGEADGKPVYNIVNRVTEVVEYEDYLLPRVIDTVIEYQKRLEQAREKFSPAVPNNVVSLTDEGPDGEDTLH